MFLRRLFFTFLCLALPNTGMAGVLSASSQSEFTRATLVSEYNAIVPGKPETMNVAVVLEPMPGWHTYWENPGDAGLPVTLTWTLPEGFTASGIDWPAPEAIHEGPLLTYSYNKTLVMPVALMPPSTLDNAAQYPIKVKAEWLICKDICVPDTAELEITLPVSTKAEPSKHSALFATHRETRPVTPAKEGGYSISGKMLTLTFPLDALKSKDIKSAQFFIREMNIIQYPDEQKLTVTSDALLLSLARTDDPLEGSVSGILSLTGKDGTVNHYNVVFNSGSGASSMNETEDLWFPVVLLLAVLGGLVLNLMPCVLPVLSLKALAVAKKGGGKHEHIVQQGVAYTLGILVSFAVIASVLLALRGAGEAVGWGYQMQSPGFVAFLAYLLFMVGLNLSGLFHLPVLLGSVGNDIANESSARGSFFTGVLATAVATPCTAPFMASAVGAALTMPAWQAILVFEALGFGLALPFLLISLFPRLRQFLPKPGAWMDTFKQLIAFPMYASVIWLLWVLTLQTGAGGMAVALIGMLLIVMVIWMKSLFKDGSNTYHAVAVAILVLVLVVSLPMLNRMEGGIAMPAGHSEHKIETVPYSKEKLAELRNAGTPVFVDATAAWCITCQVNARVALHTERTMKEFKDRGVVLMIADWTRRNNEITEFLSSFGYKGVPLCVFYPGKNGKPVVLPQILSEDIVIDTIKGE